MRKLGTRLRFAREAWGYSKEHLASLAGVNVSVIRRIEHGIGTFPQDETATRIADLLYISDVWLVMGYQSMAYLPQMTEDEQHKVHTGPGTGGLPGYVIVGPGPWFRDDDGNWRVDPDFDRSAEPLWPDSDNRTAEIDWDWPDSRWLD